MGRASYVPETFELEGEDAREAVRRARWGPLFKSSFTRLRQADGFTYTRAIGFQGLLTVFPGAIFLLAIASRFDISSIQRSVREATSAMAPGPARDILQTAFEQGQDGAAGHVVALVGGGLAAVIAGTTLMAQIQRGTTRIYGIDEDRPTLKRYSVATLLALTVGVSLAVAFAALSFGGAVTSGIAGSGGIGWTLLVLLVGLVTLVLGVALLFKVAPNRRQPSVSWLAAGGAAATVAWVVLSLLLRLYLTASSSFGEMYGPLAGFIGLALWMQLSAIALLYGMAFAAELEKTRAEGPTLWASPDSPADAGPGNALSS